MSVPFLMSMPHRPLFILFATFGAVLAQGQSKPPKDLDAPYRMRIAKWHSTADLVRERKHPKSVNTGFPLKVADTLLTGPKVPIEVYAGAVGYQWLRPNTAVRYASFKPITLDPTKRSEVEVELMRGEIQHRTGPLAGESRYRSRSGPRLAASAGTAYSVKVVGRELEVLVAEGEVKISLAMKPTDTLLIGPRQKARFGTTLPAAPTPVSPADEARIRALLSLPISSLIGYTDAEELRRKNAQEIVTLRVRPAFAVETPTKPSDAKRQPFSVVVAGDGTFESIDENGTSRPIGKGLRFVAASKEGETILGVDGSRNLFVQDYLGRRKRLASPNFKSLVSLAPDGGRAVATVEQRDITTDEKTGHVTTNRHDSIVIVGLRSPSVQGTNFETVLPVLWRSGERAALFVNRAKGQTIVVAPENYVNLITNAKAPLVTPFAEPGDWKVELSPSGNWLLATLGDKAQVVYLPTGKAVAAEGVTGLQELAGGERVLVVGALNRIVAASGGVPALRAALAGESPFASSLSYSPNGELVTFRDPVTRTAIVADSLDLSRQSDTYVGFEKEMKTSWISGDELLYESLDREKPVDVLIKLGIKRFGARPLGFGGTIPSRPTTGIGFNMDSFAMADEIIATDVAVNGTVIGFIKAAQQPSGGFVVTDTRQRVARPLAMPERDLLPFDIADDGTIFGSGFAFLSDGTHVAVPQLLASEEMKGIDAKGRALIGSSIWDPHVRGIDYPVGDGQPYGGKITPLKFVPPAGSPIAMNRSCVVLWVDREGGDKQRFWLGKWDGKAARGEATIGYSGHIELGDDGAVYADGGTFLRGRTTSTLTRYPLEGGGEPLLKEEFVGSLWLRGATKKGIPYGEITRDVGDGMMIGDKGFVVLDGEVVVLNDLLPEGYKISSIRRITDQGDIAGEVTKDGKPVGYVPNLNVLLAKRRR